jgi:prevent-host-death family protein
MSNIVVPAAEANRQFSRLLRAAASGKSVTITSHGRPVAVLGPVHQPEEQEQRQAILRELKQHWASLDPKPDVTWSRAELYDR